MVMGPVERRRETEARARLRSGFAWTMERIAYGEDRERERSPGQREALIDDTPSVTRSAWPSLASQERTRTWGTRRLGTRKEKGFSAKFASAAQRGREGLGRDLSEP